MNLGLGYDGGEEDRGSISVSADNEGPCCAACLLRGMATRGILGNASFCSPPRGSIHDLFERAGGLVRAAR